MLSTAWPRAHLGWTAAAARRIRVLLVDDHELIRTGLVRILESDPGLAVVGEAGDAEGMWPQLRATDPDVVLMDLQLPGEQGEEAALKLVAAHSRIGVLILSARARPREIQGLVMAGVRGYLTKSTSASELLAGIRRVAEGGYCFSQEIAAALAASLQSGRPDGLALSDRHLQVLRRTSQGKTTRETAEELCLSPKTVEKYRSAILQRLGARNQLEAVTRAREQGLLEE